MLRLFNEISFRTSRLVTASYSTSFSGAVRLLDHDIQDAIYSIYGFVRFADEIVDTFHSFNKKDLLEKFENDYYEALENGISLNPVLNSFQLTVKKYSIPDDLIRAFLDSMKTDLVKQNHNTKSETDDYIYGSAEVVGLMCLKVFVMGDESLFRELEMPARKLGAAFQKVNFLRDIKDDTEYLNRKYFHITIQNDFNEEAKNIIIDEIESDFAESLPGMMKLPGSSRLGVLIAYNYYNKLLKKIKKTPAGKLMNTRLRVSDLMKLFILLRTYLSFRLKLHGLKNYQN